MSSDEFTPEKESKRDWVGILPLVLASVFLFVTFLPLSGWISGAAGIGKSWLTSASILLSSAVSVLALVATGLGGRFLPRLFCGHRAGR